MDHPSGIAARRASFARTLARVRRAIARVLIGISSVVIAASVAVLGLFIFDARTAEEFTSGLRPSLFFAELPQDQLAPDLEGRYAQVIGVGHNSGDSVNATLAALMAGADAIELDVVSLDGKLYSSHATPLPWVGGGLFRGPSVEAIWAVAAQTDLVKFDLKESSPQFRQLVLNFLVAHRRQHQVAIVSDDVATLRFFAERMPEVLRFYSVGDRERLEKLEHDPALTSLIDGVSIEQSLVDAESAAWLHEHDLRIAAWTVNDMERANELIRLGVDAITTDNLAMLSLFGGQRRGEVPLEPLGATPAASPEATPQATPAPTPP